VGLSLVETEFRPNGAEAGSVYGIFEEFSGWDGAGGERAFRVKAVGLG
jgi:hypothetical protein